MCRAPPLTTAEFSSKAVSVADSDPPLSLTAPPLRARLRLSWHLVRSTMPPVMLTAPAAVWSTNSVRSAVTRPPCTTRPPASASAKDELSRRRSGAWLTGAPLSAEPHPHKRHGWRPLTKREQRCRRIVASENCGAFADQREFAHCRLVIDDNVDYMLSARESDLDWQTHGITLCGSDSLRKRIPPLCGMQNLAWRRRCWRS
eukprot:813240-Prymnesium_polylepis.2